MDLPRSLRSRAHRLRRRGALLPITGGVLLMVGVSLLGDTPDTRDTDVEIADYFVAHRAAVLTGVSVSLWASMILLGVAARLAAELRARGDHAGSLVVTGAAGVLVSVLTITTFLPLASLAYVVAGRDPAAAAGNFEATLVAAPVAAAPLSVLLLGSAWSMRATRFGQRWFWWFGGVVGAGVTVFTGAWAYSGGLSPDVAQQVVVAALGWWLVAAGFGAKTPAE